LENSASSESQDLIDSWEQMDLYDGVRRNVLEFNATPWILADVLGTEIRVSGLRMNRTAFFSHNNLSLIQKHLAQEPPHGVLLLRQEQDDATRTRDH
jgi:hypothetical protein